MSFSPESHAHSLLIPDNYQMGPVLPTRAQPQDLHNDGPGFLHLHQRPQPTDRKRKIALLISYAPDWILTLVVAGLFFLLNAIEPYKREFSLDDTSIQHTYAIHERVPDSDLFLIALLAPLIVMAVINVISIRSWWDLHTSWLGAILGLAITGTITNIIKVTVGRPRPDCIDRCRPQPGAANRPVFGLANASICTQTDNSILKDGFRSFPSGHASLSFAGLGFLSFYLAGKLHLFDERGHTAKAWISLVPLMGAALVTITRTMDNRHHWQDVLIGGLLGFFLSWFAYRQYYPALSHPFSHRPYSPRVSRIRAPLSHMRDDSAQHEISHLQPPPDARYPNGTQEGMELHGTAHGPNGNENVADNPGNLREVWKQGEGVDIPPPGQKQELPPPADERV